MNGKHIKEKVYQLLDERAEEYFRYLGEFLHHPSTLGQEESAQQYYAELLQNLGLEVDLWYPQPQDMACNPYFLPCRDDYAGSPDVVGICKGSGGGRSLLLNGHVDVVPAGKNDWEDSPWSGLRKTGRVYGRGSSDMKGGLIANLMAMDAIIKSGIKLKGDVLLASVIGEETGGAGTLSMLSRGYRADGAIVPEPSDLNICPVSLGVIWFRIRVKGLAAHAANAYLGVNAISKATLIIQALDTCNEEKRTRVQHPLYCGDNHNPFNINMGQIHGGTIATSVPDEVVIEGRIAFSPDEDVVDAKKVVEDAVVKAAEQDSWLREHSPEVEWHSFCLNSGQIPTDHPLTTAVCHAYEEVAGEPPVISGTPWGTDAGAMIRVGGIPTVVFGPGPNAKAHQANEYVEEKKLLQVAKVIASTILDWCEVQ
ncbi:peptidase [Dysosmobacter sp. NSJ-60]|uniref:Probable succinyl-diaminopimelate desuccinylase n=1 Tax=Pusillibacter faecalis TaxID=2714358 RepID=A0A810QAN7_9FIRM|nr:peptidase [Pusillibacter faecalis]MBC5747882.1 peptidase [Dysosmobacter hominis]BCK85330.1 acetylornithine deacetylase [Pusillibacter faecalis]